MERPPENDAVSADVPEAEAPDKTAPSKSSEIHDANANAAGEGEQHRARVRSANDHMHARRPRGRRPPMAGADEPPRYVKLLYWIGLCGVIAGFVLHFLFVAFSSAWSNYTAVRGAGTVILLVGVGVTLICVILWVGHITNVRPVSPWVARAIWFALIVSVLGISVGVYKNTFASTEPLHFELKLLNEQHVKVENDTPYLTGFEEKANKYYTLIPNTCNPYPGKGQNDVIIPIVAIISNFQQRADGSISVTGWISFSGDGSSLADIGLISETTTKDAWKTYQAIHALKIADIERVTGPTQDKIIYTNILRCLHTSVLGIGKRTLTVMIEDEVSHTYATQSVELNISEQNQ